MESVFYIVLANFGFWFNFSIPIAIALFLAISHKEYIWKEFGIQVGVTFLYVVSIYLLMFSTTTDLIDTEVYNGKAVKFTKWEKWKERQTYTETYSCGTSKNPRTCTRTKTRIVSHPEYWELLTSNGEVIQVKRRDYLRAASNFGTKEVDVYRSNQVSHGDGDKWVSYPNIVIPTAVEHNYENPVRAVKSNVLHTKVPEARIKQLIDWGRLREYPRLYVGEYGSTQLNRFIDTTAGVKAKYLDDLNKMSVSFATKQANPIIYVTKEDRDFKDALEHYWSKGKKNDITLILGVDKDSNILWSDVITYTDNTDFIIDIQNKFKGKNINTDKSIILKTYNDLVMTSYKRKPMKDFDYLKDSITLEWYWQLLIFLGNLGVSGFVMYKMMTNYSRKRGRY